MTDSYRKNRQQVENAFAAVQSQFLARDSSASDVDAEKQAREEKTLRLRKARLAKENEDAGKLNPSPSNPVLKA